MRSETPLVGVVDSGAGPEQASWIGACAAFDLVEGRVVRRDAGPDRLGHGSALIDVIAALAPGVCFVVAQVFHERPTTTAAQVAAAIDWLVAQRVGLINLSLGLSRDRELLREACERALRAGVLLCAAAPARGEAVYPAAYPGVFRMTGDARCARAELSHLDTRQADFGAHVRPLDGSATGGGASLGCAHLSGHLARYLAAGGARRPSAARAWLIEQASYRGPEQRR
ncbi:MAG TPA: S8 family serine peptidase [Rhodocyclaceae bacterium]|nr:S8 family serine peptidase [Rhodocyclaceae bacterium]